MIESLSYSADFPISGASIRGTFQPGTGVTAVVGPNGSGKTFGSIECCRWLLFGKKALRGAAADYKNTEANGTFVIRGERLHISRGKKDSIKNDQGVELAVGPEKVTEVVERKLGYDLEVFDLCNAAVQGEVQRLGKMMPSERKKIIDRVLSITDVEDTEKACRKEAEGYRREAEALTSSLRTPRPEPVKSLIYRPSSTVRQELEDARNRSKAIEELRSRLRHITEPVKPDEEEFDGTEVQAHEERRRELRHRRMHLEALVQKVPEILSEEQIVKAVELHDWMAEKTRRGPEPTMSEKSVVDMLKVWEEIHTLERMADVETECPKCREIFRTRKPLPPAPALSEAELREQLARHDRWRTPIGPMPFSESCFNETRADEYRKAAEAQRELETLEVLEDRSEELSKYERLRAEWAVYRSHMASYEAAVASNKAVEDQLAMLGDVDLEPLYNELRESEIYERDVEEFEREQARYNADAQTIRDKTALATAFQNGAKELAEARATIKSLLAPRISRIASSLLVDMTNGKLRQLEMDEDMNIKVDGQKLETLSGAGMTVANIALRVAMGQALVANAFPVFLADEIDGDLDHERREAVLESMKALSSRLQQIILVTHRDVAVADHVHSTS